MNVRIEGKKYKKCVGAGCFEKAGLYDKCKI